RRVLEAREWPAPSCRERQRRRPAGGVRHRGLGISRSSARFDALPTTRCRARGDRPGRNPGPAHVRGRGMMDGFAADFIQKAGSDSANRTAPSENRFGYAARVPQVAGLLAAGGGALVLIGWVFDIGPVKAPIPGGVAMKANTAAAFVLAGAAVWLSKAGVRPSRVVCLLASVVGITG